ncbi:hypothetical protein CLIB1423_01S05666 [[Candida] railenensis]|uniref:Uncharacterized protein n=1 Tax=[Candida] railenensis TaxID=45579 RepID=A0A9P0QKC6_9ASCO|nr:hypothetical protein CLIB1423_01S05666 [[Candida] railenensis]
MFELVGIPNTWFSTADEESLRILTRIINKSYDKPRFKFGVIGSSRVKSPQTFPSDFEISHKKPFVLYLLLGPADRVKSTLSGVPRDFSVISQNITEAYDSDIPARFVDDLSFDKHSDFSISIVGDDYRITNDILERVIGTVGFKEYVSTGSEHVKELELTSFTSFLKNSGPHLLEVVIEKVLLRRTEFDKLFGIDRNKLKSFKINGVVIKEHGLVKYYTSKCGFIEAAKEDTLIEVDKDGNLVGNELEDGIIAFKSFHLSYIYRLIEL